MEDQPALMQVLEGGGRPQWLSMREEDTRYLAMARAITDKNDFQQHIGTLVIAIDL